MNLINKIYLYFNLIKQRLSSFIKEDKDMELYNDNSDYVNNFDNSIYCCFDKCVYKIGGHFYKCKHCNKSVKRRKPSMQELDPKFKTKLKLLITLHEGYRRRAYLDQYNNITVGYGHNLSAHDIEDNILEKWYEDDVNFFYSRLNDSFPWFKNLNIDRQIALIDMCFMGFNKFLTFKKMISNLEKGDYNAASYEILNSNYAKQVGNRASNLAYVIRSGTLTAVI